MADVLRLSAVARPVIDSCLRFCNVRSGIFLLVLCMILCGSWRGNAAQAQSATSTTLVIASGTGPATSVASGSVVTLTASVTTASAPVKIGQVNFCDASVAYCTDIHRIGTAQLTSAGTAVIKFQPGLGSHSYKAIFAGTNSCLGSTSAAAALSVTGTAPTTTLLQTSSPSSGTYDLTATVSGFGSAALTGSISFTNLSDASAVLGTATLSAGTAGLNFLELQNIGAPNIAPGGGAAVGIATADFNGDGISDLAVLNSGTSSTAAGSVTVLLGSGGGNFKAVAANPATGQGSGVIVTADFNGDGIPDIAVANGTTNNITVLLGNGDGTFAATPNSPATGSGPNAMIASDFNGDGIPDLAIVNGTSNTLTILLGNGDGSFTPTTNTQQTGAAPYFIATADFNGDGIADLALLNSDGGTDTLTIYLGNGAGGFTLVTTGPGAGTAAAAIAIADFNGDGIPDIAIENYVVNGAGLDSTVTVTVSVLQGNGDGTFQAESGVSFQSQSASADALLVADFNNDGIPDVAVDLLSQAEVRFPNSVAVLLGTGSSMFTTTAISSETGLFPAPLIAGDFNGDGIPDLATPFHDQTVFDPGSVNLLVTFDQTATATASGIALPPSSGMNEVVANYPGDSNFSASASAPVSLTALAGPATISVTSSIASPISYGTSITFTATLTGAGATPTGTVTFYDGSGQLAASQLQNGVATYTSANFSVGTHSIAAQYAGDANYTSGTSSVFPLVVKPANANVTITPSSSSLSTAQSLNVTVTVSGAAGSPSPTGTVILSGGGINAASPSYASAPMTLVSGSATFTVSGAALGAGQDTLVAAYTPDATSAGLYAASSGRTVVIVTGTGAPTLTITPSATSITNQQSLTVAVAIAGISGSPAPTGAITLTSGSYSAQMTLPNAAFSISAGTLSAGSNTLTAAYSGDGLYMASSGTATVNVSDVVVSATTPSPVTPGSSTTSTITLNTGSSYSGTLNLSCSLTTPPANAQSLPTCTLNPAAATVMTGATATTSLTVKTTAAATALLQPFDRLRGMGGGGLALAGLVMLGTSLRRRRWLSVLAMLAIGISGAGIGCGGNGNGSGSPNPPPTTAATTAGSYVFTVTATDSTNSSITASSTVSVMVQ
ncbi:hypothetical protein HNQ77_003655 [Silvibacterium bohemicum]|uniref:PKD domain-containing protein n=1 Tax=Silvibacterium bohemicum TaxID=1577686 RepID=A0A841K607_9BACT|nr:FG-GAP-like repeat-containing protein [Silvibacterium bohemicum]MBB6145694.1 hypothetical protein [Silvibacterium bohemicum]